MNNPIVTAIENRVSTNLFDAGKALTDAQIVELTSLATRAPTAYNLQNWRFIAVRSAEAKTRLQAAAYGQAKVTEAAVTYIVCGQRPVSKVMEERLQPSVEAGFMPSDLIGAWTKAVEDSYSGNAQMQRDEAVRTATLGAAFLMFAAEAFGLTTGPMVGFDPEAVAREFNLATSEIPVVLIAVGHAREGNWPQKPRLPVSQVLEFA
ncbi:nitroreductase family protein [Paracoccus saliphilus]|uniref:Nitroreductase n=1 Tax=Paracoccus saliphilus TaxID=405559 RepID=A0AA46A7R1_9RHOB|nr:nitroreductase family protein [Paracoccus saliphilus]WCR02676.1 nitroreductase family protein [Paracoccus saliphilus]SIT17359.1 Nitroreductase [Paracoccus saliphilus]